MGGKKPSGRELEKQREEISEVISGLSIFNEIKDGVNVVNEQYEILFANKVLEDIFGLWQGRKCYEYFENNTKVCDGCPGPAVSEGKTVWREWYCSRNGRTYELIDTPLRNPDGSISKIEVLRDITGRKRAEDALRASEEKYRLVAENIPVMVYSALPDEHSTNLFTSGWVVELTGYSAQEFMDDPELFGNLIHPDDREYVWQQVEVLRREKKTLDLEYRIVVRDGSIKWIRDRTTSMVDENGETTRINGFMEDITKRKLAEDSLRESREQLQRYSKELELMVEDRTAQIRELQKQQVESEKLAATGRMAAKIAHEINNPLAGIKNSFLLVKDIVEKEHPHYAYVGRIESEIDRIAVVVRRMFDLYSPDRKEPREIAIGDVLRDVVSLLESSSRPSDISLETSVPEAPVIAFIPVGYANQILFNVVSNAIDASEPGGSVSVVLTADDGSVTITVTDRGRGIPEEIADRIFEPFFTTKDGAEMRGLGLGLSITKSMVEASGGSISFESVPSEGTVFTVKLPLKPAA
jgi:PAS domain S-box-containing protein